MKTYKYIELSNSSEEVKRGYFYLRYGSRKDGEYYADLMYNNLGFSFNKPLKDAKLFDIAEVGIVYLVLQSLNKVKDLEDNFEICVPSYYIKRIDNGNKYDSEIYLQVLNEEISWTRYMTQAKEFETKQQADDYILSVVTIYPKFQNVLQVYNILNE